MVVSQKILADSDCGSLWPDGLEGFKTRLSEGLYSGPGRRYQEASQSSVRRKEQKM